MQQIIFIADFIECSTCFGQTMPIIMSSRVLYRWKLPVVFGFQVVGMVWSWRLCVRFAGCNKYHLLHLVGILFPHNEACVSHSTTELVGTENVIL